jgi:hypothetical protein
MTMFNNGRGCITLPEFISALEIEGLPRKKSAEDEATNESGSEEKKRPIVKRAKVVEIKTFPRIINLSFLKEKCQTSSSW